MEHVELEVSLEIIMAKLADEIRNMNDDNRRFKYLLDIQDKAYAGDRNSILKILNNEV